MLYLELEYYETVLISIKRHVLNSQLSGTGFCSFFRFVRFFSRYSSRLLRSITLLSRQSICLLRFFWRSMFKLRAETVLQCCCYIRQCFSIHANKKSRRLRIRFTCTTDLIKRIRWNAQKHTKFCYAVISHNSMIKK